MDWLTFLSNTIDSLAWPAVMLFAVYLFRDHIGNSLAKLKRLKFKGAELDFAEEINTFKKLTDQLLSGVEHEIPEVKLGEIRELVGVSRRAVIMESWLVVEEAIRKFANKHGIKIPDNRPITGLRVITDNLSKSGSNHFDTVLLLEQLRKLRDEAVDMSDLDIDVNSAIEYAELSYKVVGLLEKA